MKKAGFVALNSGAPFLDVWRANSSVMTSGCVCGDMLYLASIVITFTDTAYSGVHVGLLLLSFATAICGCIWSMEYYPSLFSYKPRTMNTDFVSFCNGLFGGFIAAPWLSSSLSKIAIETQHSFNGWKFSTIDKSCYSGANTVLGLRNGIFAAVFAVLLLVSLFAPFLGV